MLLLDTPMQPLPTGSTPSFRRSRSLSNLEMSISLLDEGNPMTKLVRPSKDNNHEDDTEMTIMELFSQFGDFDNIDDEFLGASLTSSSSPSSFGGNPLDWTRQSEDEKKRTSCAPAQVKYDCFGFPLFDLQADSQPADQQVKIQVPVLLPVTHASASDANITVDAEKEARRARRRRSKPTVKNQDTSAPSVPVVTLAAPQPQPHAPMRRRRSTGLLSSSAVSHPWHQDSAESTETTSSAPTKGSSTRANGGHRTGSTQPRRRKSLGGGGMRTAMTNVSQSVPSPSQYQRTSSVQLSQNSHQKKNSPRQTRRSLSNGNLRLNKEEEKQPVADKPNTDKKASRRRSGNGKRRGSMNAMSKSDTGHSNRRPSMKSSMGSSSAPNHPHNHKSSSTSSGRRSTVAAMEDVYEQNTTPDDYGRRDRRRSQRKDMSVTNKRFNRSMSRMNIKRQDSGPSLTTR